MNERRGRSEETIAMIAAVFARHPEVERVKLHGSRAKGNYRSGSDIDLTLQGGEDLKDRVLYSIVRELDDLPLPYFFDVAIHSMIANEALLEHIRRRGAVFYERHGGENSINKKIIFKFVNSRCNKKRLSAVRGRKIVDELSTTHNK
jgi:predicted nucleotidyltransferase